MSLNLNSRRKTATILFEVEKAFEKVWGIAVSSASHLKVPSVLITILTSLLSEKYLNIKIEGKTSTSRQILARVSPKAHTLLHIHSVYTSTICQPIPIASNAEYPYKRIEAIQTIGLRNISGNPTFVRNDILRRSAGHKAI